MPKGNKMCHDFLQRLVEILKLFKNIRVGNTVGHINLGLKKRNGRMEFCHSFERNDCSGN